MARLTEAKQSGQTIDQNILDAATGQLAAEESVLAAVRAAKVAASEAAQAAAAATTEVAQEAAQQVAEEVRAAQKC